MNHAKKSTGKKSTIALILGMLLGFAVLAILLWTVIGDQDAAETMLWVGFACALLPAVLLTEENKTAKF